MHLKQLVEDWGYVAVLIGTILEGETILVLAGFMAHQGHLNPFIVGALALVGGFLGDQIYFYLGRRHGTRLLERKPAWKARMGGAHRLMSRYPNLIIPLSRFLYGFRIVIPIAIGLTSVSAVRFALMNLLGAAVWAALFTVLGYVFGAAMEPILAGVAHYEKRLMVVVVVVAAGVWGVHHVLGRRAARAALGAAAKVPPPSVGDTPPPAS